MCDDDCDVFDATPSLLCAKKGSISGADESKILGPDESSNLDAEESWILDPDESSNLGLPRFRFVC